MAKKGQKRKKYLENLENNPNYIDPRLVYKAIADETQELINIFAKRRFVTLLTKVDVHR